MKKRIKKGDYVKFYAWEHSRYIWGRVVGKGREYISVYGWFGLRPVYVGAVKTVDERRFRRVKKNWISKGV